MCEPRRGTRRPASRPLTTPVRARSDKCACRTLRVPLKDARYARAIFDSLVVDEELQPERVRKSLSLEGTTLVVSFAAEDWRMLRVASISFMEFLAVAVRCVNTLPPPSDLRVDGNVLLNPNAPSDKYLLPKS
jgi:EKC/KEOPS complex subunit PCC1/LAGE3